MSEDSSKHVESSRKTKSDLLRTRKNSNSYKPAGKFGHPAVVLLSAFAAFIASQFFALIILEIIWTIFGAGTKPLDLENSTSDQFIFIALSELLAVLLVWQILRWRRLGFRDIGLGRRPVLSDLVKAGLGFGAFYGLLIISGLVLSHFLPGLDTNQKQDVGFHNLQSDFAKTLAFIGLVIFPPIGEEILVRGYLYSGLRSSLNFIPSLLITSGLFAAAHLQTGQGTSLLWAAAINTFVLSLVLVYLREKTGALYAGMLIHALNNVIAFTLYINGS